MIGNFLIKSPSATLEEMNEIPEAELPLIDPRKDDDKVGILIDEGCNSICHGEHWRQEAEKIMPGCIKKIGNTGSSYTGVGNAECTGVYMIYFCIKLDPSGMCLRGSFKSNELKGSDTPLLLSLPAQSKLGLIKDVRRGLCHLEDYPGQRLPLARSVRTGLVMCCINESTNLEAQVQWPLGEDSAHEVCLMAERVHVSPRDKPVKISTFGIETVGITDQSTRRSKKLHSLIRSLDQGSYSFSLSDDTHLRTLLDDFKMNHPGLVADYSNDEILFLDCRGVGDPSRDRNLRDHIGTHPQNLEHMSKAREWEVLYRESNRMISEKLRREDTEKLLVLVFCRAGRHRSVATGHVLCHNLQADGSIVSLEHMSPRILLEAHVWWRVQVLQP